MFELSIVEKGDKLYLSLDMKFINAVKIADPYYLLSEIEQVRGESLLSIVRSAAKYLFLSWVSLLEESRSKVIYLPFDFSDQYIGCVRCLLVDIYSVRVSYGYTQAKTGHSIDMSRIDEFELSDIDYVDDTRFFDTTINDLVFFIRKSAVEMGVSLN